MGQPGKYDMNAAKTIAVLGARGMLGTELCAELERAGHAVNPFDLPELNITDATALEKAVTGHDAVVNCAAYTNVDAAERNAEAAYKVNADAVAQLGQIAKRQGIFTVHISTDFVYDGKLQRPYREHDIPHPLCVYGASKLQGEKELAASGCDSCIIRVQWSYGANGVNFISKLVALASERQELKVVNDQLGSPTWTRDMARAIRCLLDKRQTGLYLFAASGYASRYDTARFIAERLSLKTRIAPCSSAEFPVLAERPKNSRFDTVKIQRLLDFRIRPWREPLAEFLAGFDAGARR